MLNDFDTQPLVSPQTYILTHSSSSRLTYVKIDVIFRFGCKPEGYGLLFSPRATVDFVFWLGSTDICFNVPSATRTTRKTSLPFSSSSPALTALPSPYSSAIGTTSERSIRAALKHASSILSLALSVETGVTISSPTI